MSEQTIGVIGLGAMGAPMAERLIDAGYHVVSCANRNREAIERLAEKGLTELADPSAVGAASNLVISVVFDEEQNDLVLRDGVLPTMRPGGTVLVTSTVSPQYCQGLAAEAAERNLDVLDCPLSGMPAGAQAGALTLMIGGNTDVIDRWRPALEVLGTVAPCGDVGMGQVMKVANNAMALGTWSLLMEVRELVQQQGMDLSRFMDILNQSSGRSFVSENFPLPPQRVPLPPMARKDLGIFLDLAASADTDAPMVTRCVEAGS